MAHSRAVACARAAGQSAILPAKIKSMSLFHSLFDLRPPVRLNAVCDSARGKHARSTPHEMRVLPLEAHLAQLVCPKMRRSRPPSAPLQLLSAPTTVPLPLPRGAMELPDPQMRSRQLFALLLPCQPAWLATTTTSSRSLAALLQRMDAPTATTASPSDQGSCGLPVSLARCTLRNGAPPSSRLALCGTRTSIFLWTAFQIRPLRPHPHAAQRFLVTTPWGPTARPCEGWCCAPATVRAVAVAHTQPSSTC